MIWEKPYWPFIEAGDDFNLCADYLEHAGYEDEFCIHPHISPEAIESAALAGFFPMAALAGSASGVKPVLMPKLHLGRCLLHPGDTHVTKTARRESARYTFSLNTEFETVLSLCAETHGRDWLVEDLGRALVAMHDDRFGMRVRLVSVEIREGDLLVAGELGYCAGSCYTSLSGFRTESGSGTVQLAALGSFLASGGFTVWDLGMPEPDYKLRLGGSIREREAWLATVREAYANTAPESMIPATSRVCAADILSRPIDPA